MRYLIVGDSHTWNLDSAIIYLRPEHTTYSISLGRQMPQIAALYNANLLNIMQFNPQIAIVHWGHNDIVQHHHLNPVATHPQTVAADTITFANMLQTNHPGITVYNSSIFPRSATYNSLLDEQSVLSYNKKAKRYGQHLRDVSHQAGHKCLLNNILWRRISKAQEESYHFRPDGLHIYREAQLLVADELLRIIESA
jgi:hypothetical protein